MLKAATTAIYLAAFVSWMGEDSAGSPRTPRLLDGLLAQAEAVMQACPGRMDWLVSGKA